MIHIPGLPLDYKRVMIAARFCHRVRSRDRAWRLTYRAGMFDTEERR